MAVIVLAATTFKVITGLVTLFKPAVILVLPTAIPVARPPGEVIVAAAGLELTQVTWLVILAVVPLE